MCCDYFLHCSEGSIHNGDKKGGPQPKSATQFPNVIGYAPTKQILAMYGNPHTPLLPHFPSDIWSNNDNNSGSDCFGCHKHNSALLPPSSPQKYNIVKGSLSNLSAFNWSNSLPKTTMLSPTSANGALVPRHFDDGQFNDSKFNNHAPPTLVAAPTGN